MPSISNFQLKNFKGIETLSIDLDDKTECPVITLIGLNESGKTTILEGLSHFVSGDKSVSGLFDGVHAKSSGAGLIPVHRKAAFTSNIDISSTIKLDDEDIRLIQEIGSQQKLVLNEAELLKPFEVRKEFKFEDSVLQSTKSYWGFKLEARPERGTKFKKYTPSSSDESKNLWLDVVHLIERRLPQVSYFPTFLVDMPSRIYLREHEGESAVNRKYRYVFQDILDSLDEGLSLEKHVCKRIEDFKESEASPNWFSIFFGGASRSPIDSVFQKISHTVTKQVLGSWQRIFQRTTSAKSISVEWNIDTENDDLPYASFFVSDGESRYAINERSLGFRWFFSFLLFTAFKQGKERATLFVFDEPAANLHAKAQAELLTSFEKIAAGDCKIIYSTHSHHMLNPRWLSGAYIVENTALDYDGDDSFGLGAKPTNIKITKYRDFVSQYPTRTSYFQPVIEKLEYVTPEIIGQAPFVIVEGISDFYALSLAKTIGQIETCYNLIPGAGAGAAGPLISLLLGRGEQFMVLLDDDAAGKREASRYINDWYLSPDQVQTLGNINSHFSGKCLEALIDSQTIALIQKNYSTETQPTKKQICWYLAEMCANANRNALAPKALSDLTDVLKHLNSCLAS